MPSFHVSGFAASISVSDDEVASDSFGVSGVLTESNITGDIVTVGSEGSNNPPTLPFSWDGRKSGGIYCSEEVSEPDGDNENGVANRSSSFSCVESGRGVRGGAGSVTVAVGVIGVDVFSSAE